MIARSQEWLGIWENKYGQPTEGKDLHVLDGCDGMSYDEWQRLSRFFLDRLRIGPDDDVLEVGCGTGAFLKEIPQCRSLSGVDYSENAVSVIRQHLEGDFQTAEAAELPFEDAAFDFVLSFGVYLYFDSLDYARRALDEMCRVCRPSGTIFVGEVNDLAKKNVAQRLREQQQGERTEKHLSKGNPDHIYYSKDFFSAAAAERGLSAQFFDEDVAELDFYYNGPYRFSVAMSQ